MKLKIEHAIWFLAVLQVIDLCMSLYAFSKGIGEANPVMAWALANGFFIEAKIGLAVLIVGLMIVVRRNRFAQTVIYTACVLMSLVAGYHLYYLPQLLAR